MSRANEPKLIASDATGISPRALNVVLGTWLCISAFAWPHARWQLTNTLISGVLVVVFALGACLVPRVRFLNTTLSAYLFVSAWYYHSITLPEMATQWHNATVALWIFLSSVLDHGPGAVGTRSFACDRPRSRASA
jgi:hypothetical protein